MSEAEQPATSPSPFAPPAGRRWPEGPDEGPPGQQPISPESTKTRAQHLREKPTDAERKLWYCLRDRRLGGHKFVRQLPIGRYVADFACREAKLIVEVDGSGHSRGDRDATRDASLIQQGYRVLRFWNPEVLQSIDGVCETILVALDGRLEPYERFKTAALR